MGHCSAQHQFVGNDGSGLQLRLRALLLHLLVAYILVRGRGFSEGDLLLSTAPAFLGACGNVSGGFVSDAMVKRLGLTWGRRTVGLIGLSFAALCTIATI